MAAGVFAPLPLQYPENRARRPGAAGHENPFEVSIKALSRHAARLVAAAALVAFALFALAVIGLRYGVLPRAGEWRADVEASLSRASGMAVRLDGLAAGWDGLHPHLALSGLSMDDRKGRPALRIERADAVLSWWSLFAGDLRFAHVELQGPRIALRRDAAGVIHLGDQPLNAPAGDDDGAFAAWLLSQPHLAVHDAVLGWRDERTGAPPLVLEGVEISVRKAGRRHRAALTARPPAGLAARIDLKADLQFGRESGAWRSRGTVYAEGDKADLAALRAHLPLPETLRHARGAFRVWLEVEPGAVRAVTADIAAAAVRARLAADALPLDLESFRGRIEYGALPGGYRVGTRGLAFRTVSGLEAKAAEFSIALSREEVGPPRGEVRADAIDLKIAAALLDYLPVPREAKARVLRLAPRGRIDGASLVWTGASPAEATTWRVRGRFEDLSLNADEAVPGATGLTGQVEGDEKGGTLKLASRGATFEAGRIFRAPLAFDRLEGDAAWTRGPSGLEVRIRDARAENAGAALTVSGLWRALPAASHASPGYVELAGRVERASARVIPDYLPNGIAITRGWLDDSLLAGEASDGRFELKGDLWHFPWRDGAAGKDGAAGRFHVDAAFREGKLRYHPAWPAIDRVKGRIVFDNAGLSIEATEGAVYGSRVRSARARIADLGANPPLLEIEGDVDTSGPDGVRFLRETPLVEGPGAFTRTVSIDGAARLKLRLAYPLWGTEAVRVAGEVAFAGATASVGRTLHLTGLRGQLAFTERSVKSTDLAGTMFGQPAQLRLSTQPDGTVLTQLDGRLTAGVMGAFLPEAFVRRMAGATDWKARLATGAEGTELRIESTLAGLAVGLPEPFAKSAPESRPLAVTIRRLGTPREETVATFAGNVHARVGRAGDGEAAKWHAALKFGAPVEAEPVREGLWLYGSLARFDLDAWQEALAPPAGAAAGPRDGAGAPALELQGLDLDFGLLRYTGRDFRQLEAKLGRTAGVWKGHLVSPAVAGAIEFDPRGRGRIQARLARFSLAAPRSGEAGPEPASPAEGDLPDLDIVAERFDFRGRWLGRLELRAAHAGEEWRIEKLDLTNGHAQLRSTGNFRRTAGGPLTRLDARLETSNLNALLGQFGHGDQVKGGEGRLEGQLLWPGYPYEFTPSILSGRFRVEAAKGQFARIEPGAGKLLGLMSLQSIPRRVTFDFRDIFSEGFAFDRIAGEVKLARGILLVNDFEVAGPSAQVTMAGEISLPMETQHLTMRVVPEVGEGVAIAATVLGTPALGLTTLLAQKLLANPLGKAVAYEYLVTGSWDNPSVTRLTTAPPAAGRPESRP